jgi:putative SOS response-associated peptidase YedK
MCDGFALRDPVNTGYVKKVYFPNPATTKHIQVIKPDGTETIASWGRREALEEPFALPMGGWARIENMDWWRQYSPEKVYIPAFEFYEKGHLWPCGGHPLTALLCRIGEYRVFYIVTKPAPREYLHIHDRIPVLANVTQKICSKF